MSELVTEEQLRHAFWHSVIQTQNTTRFVAQSEMQGGSNGPASPMRIYVPQGPEDDFDLVLSLCVDGTQRVTIDWDNDTAHPPQEVIAKFFTTVRLNDPFLSPAQMRVQTATPSTCHWALWGDAQVTWTTVVKALRASNNPGYVEMNHLKGFCGLRPPWKNKHDIPFHDAIGERYDRAPDRDMFAGVDWSNGPIPVPEGTGWEDIFGDDE